MYKIGIIDLDKIEVLRELTNEFLMPKDYLLEVINPEDGANWDIVIDAGEFRKTQDGITDSQRRELAKRELYFSLTKLTGYSPLWGTLTGVRPVKLAGELVEKLGREETYNRLRDYYLISEEKTNSILDMYDYQMNSLGKADNNSISLYIGIPFCPTRCLYCSFASNQVPDSEIEKYLPALVKEIESVSTIIKERGYITESIYMGGGTPTTLTSNQMKMLLSEINKHFDIDGIKEFTVEAGRPDTIDKDKLLVLKDFGVGRISINPQSMKESTLKLIGRSHSVKEIEKAFSLAQGIGFDSINCDTIAGLPEETLDDMKHTLNELYEMGPDNITVHCLAVKRASRLNEEDPDYHYRQGVITREMLDYADSFLKEKGFNPYYLYRQKNMAGSGENTGYSLPGKEGLYNVRIMDEHQTIIAMGAGGITKYYHPEENRLERVPNVTNYQQYIERIDEMIWRKKNAN